MLHKLTSSYREIAKYFPELSGLLSTPARNKQLLFKMAGNGGPRPRSNTPLGTALNRYVNKSLGCYDPIFAIKIRRAAPNWFISRSNIAQQKKKKLLNMARKGKYRPNREHPLGQPLSSYTLKSSGSYDPIFTKEIKKLAPDWLLSKSEKADQKKQLLLKMAKKGEPRPNQKKTPLGKLLINYTCKHSRCYDQKFNREIRLARPDWFVSQTERANLKKKELLKMAKKGQPRPSLNTSLGVCLSNYTTKSAACYDPKFDKTIRKLLPDWFVSKSEVANQTKIGLLKMAKKGEPRPNQKTPLGNALVRYTTKSPSHDPIFTKQIKKIAPDWFKTCSTRSKVPTKK